MRIIWLAACGLALAAAPAWAQREAQIGSRLTPRQTLSVAQDSRSAAVAGHRFAGCVYLQQRARVIAALDVVDSNDARYKLNALRSKGTCLNLLTINDFADSQRVEMPLDIYRGMLAEAVIQNEYRKRALAALKPQASYSRPWFSSTGRPTDSDEMSVCVAEVDPSGVQALLNTVAETGAEDAAIRNLSAALGSCLATGVRLTANRQSLRAGLAEALYHRLTTAEVATQPGDAKK